MPITRIFTLLLLFLPCLALPHRLEPPVENQLRKVVIDAGHGGHDPGALGRVSKEKNIALAISLKVGGYITELLPDVQVIYTRTTDEFKELHQRAQIANVNKADLFISIHVNSAPHAPEAYGTETYVLGLHRTKENLEVAKRENSTILLEEDHQSNYSGFDPNSPEAYIIFSLAQNAFLERSVNLAAKIESEFSQRVNRKSRGVKQAGLLVLARSTMPSVLVETGFISNSAEERYLNSEEGQTYLASAIFRAVRDFKKEIERKTAE